MFVGSLKGPVLCFSLAVNNHWTGLPDWTTLAGPPSQCPHASTSYPLAWPPPSVPTLSHLTPLLGPPPSVPTLPHLTSLLGPPPSVPTLPHLTPLPPSVSRAPRSPSCPVQVKFVQHAMLSVLYGLLPLLRLTSLSVLLNSLG